MLTQVSRVQPAKVAVLLLLGEPVTSRNLMVRYHLLIFTLSERPMALYSAKMLSQTQSAWIIQVVS